MAAENLTVDKVDFQTYGYLITGFTGLTVTLEQYLRIDEDKEIDIVSWNATTKILTLYDGPEEYGGEWVLDLSQSTIETFFHSPDACEENYLHMTVDAGALPVNDITDGVITFRKSLLENPTITEGYGYDYGTAGALIAISEAPPSPTSKKIMIKRN